MTEDTRVALERIDDVIADRGLDVQFNPGATAEQLDTLVADVAGSCEGGDLAPVQTLFRWHNGQPCGTALIPGENRRLLTAHESVEALKFFLLESEFLQPYRSEWIPIATNDCGDYLVFEVSSGSLIGYWHDDPMREVEYLSVQEFAKSVTERLSESVPSSRHNRLLETEDPASLVISVSQRSSDKNLELAKGIRSISGEPLVAVVGRLKNVYPDTLADFSLASAVNSLERALLVTSVRNLVASADPGGSQLVIKVSSASGRSESVTLEDLDQLHGRCMTG